MLICYRRRQKNENSAITNRESEGDCKEGERGEKTKIEEEIQRYSKQEQLKPLNNRKNHPQQRNPTYFRGKTPPKGNDRQGHKTAPKKESKSQIRRKMGSKAKK